jgi:SAM-dependent methyltransferase
MTPDTAPIQAPAAAPPLDDFAAHERARREQRIAWWDAIAPQRDRWRKRGRVYHDEVQRLLRFLIPRGSRVLEVGCATGDVLNALEPASGVGVDFSPRMIELARTKFPALDFVTGDAQELETALAPLPAARRDFDYVVMSDLVGHVGDVWTTLRQARRVVRDDTKLVITWYSFLWEPILKLGERVGMKMPVHPENWLSLSDLEGFLALNHFEVVHAGSRVLFPLDVPIVSHVLNGFVAKLPLFRSLNLARYLVARPLPIPEARSLTTSVIVPCRNERGNVAPAIARMPMLGPKTEVIFCDGHSTDGTVEEIERVRADGRERPFTIELLNQDGTGKKDAVWKAFRAAKHDLLMILDADLTVPPEDLPKFHLAVAEGKGELINGTRLVYPMEGGAMRVLNTIGNKFFSLALSWILGQRIKDTLCGTKVLLRSDWKGIESELGWSGAHDPFGDFDLILGAAKRNLRIRDLPVRYRARTYGETKISRFRDGVRLLRLVRDAFLRLKWKR